MPPPLGLGFPGAAGGRRTAAARAASPAPSGSPAGCP